MSSPPPNGDLLKRVLTTTSARIGQRVEVYVHPHVDPCPYLGERGVIRKFPDPIKATAGVQLDAFGRELLWIPLYQLHPID